jgi:hypothetical protein
VIEFPPGIGLIWQIGRHGYSLTNLPLSWALISMS